MNFLLEIGTEEIPHWMIPGALDQLLTADLFGATSSSGCHTAASGGPSRVDSRSAQPDQEQVIKGPPISAGDKAAGGFAKKHGVELSAMTKAGDYYELRKLVPGRAVRDILGETLAATILGIQWPKTMYWVGGKTGPRFIRPIRWIVALLGDEVIPFELAGVKSGGVTSRASQVGFGVYSGDVRDLRE